MLSGFSAQKSSHMLLRVDHWVEARTTQEVLHALDRNSRMDGVPFMLQMFEYCGQRFRGLGSAHKTYDPAFTGGGRRLGNAAVHLSLRCDGKAYDACQAGCLIFWKEAWLKLLSASSAGCDASLPVETPMPEKVALSSCSSEEDVWRTPVRMADKTNTTRDMSAKPRGFASSLRRFHGGTWRILEDVWCRFRFSTCRMFCPRALYSWWCEIWLERVPASEGNDTAWARGASRSQQDVAAPVIGA